MNFRNFTARYLFAILAALALPTLASAQKSGYVWADNPSSASYTPSTTYSFNSSGGAIGITRSGVGVYAVRFGGIGGGGSAGGNVLVTAYGPGSETCKVVSWDSGGVDFVVNVRCFNTGGGPADTRYTARVIMKSGAASGKNGYAWADNPSSVAYTPSPTYSFNSSGGAISINRSGVGTYAVRFSGLGAPTAGGNVQVTAYGAGSETCKVVSWGSGGPDFTVNVRCFTTSGGPVDTRYSVNVVW